MSTRWLGIIVGSDRVTVVDAEVPKSGAIVIQADHSWPLQKGDRALAYSVMHQQVGDYARENHVVRAVVKESAVSLGGTKKTHLQAAELRGVILSALAAVTKTDVISKAHISREFGERTVDEYVKDEAFWSKEIVGTKVRIGSREAAIVILAARKLK